MKSKLFPFSVACVAATISTPGHADVRPVVDPQPKVQLALLLDTSNSMDGLIDQARSRLWQVVNELANARCAGQRPRLEVALFEYGNNSLDARGNYIRRVSGFTEDLDLLSAHLFGLRTNGGQEYCGAVIEQAVEQLAWTRESRDLKLVFIAGNEPFSQGPVNYRTAVRNAFHQGITINTIFCGPEAEGIETGWKDGAVLGDRCFAFIDQNQRRPHIDAPHDKRLAALNEALNKTYVSYGAAGEVRRENQRAQDANAAAAAPSSFAERISAKASGLYRNTSWDLIDAVKEGEVDLDAMDKSDLPAELRSLPEEQRTAKIAELSAERARIQKQIQQLSAERQAYVDAELKKHAEGSSVSLDDAILRSVRTQGGKKNYVFEGGR